MAGNQEIIEREVFYCNTHEGFFFLDDDGGCLDCQEQWEKIEPNDERLDEVIE